MILAIDNGFSHTKVIGEKIRRIFPSAYTTNVLASTNAHITIDGIKYCVGVGNTVYTPDKTNHEINKACTLYSMAMYGDGDYYLVGGLPIGQYKAQKNSFIEATLNYNNCEITYRDKEVKINIKDVTVYPQGAAVLYHLEHISGKYIIVDIGAFTIDVALIEMASGYPTLINHDTWFKGISTLYSSIAEVLNNTYNLTLNPSDVEEVLVHGELKIDGELVDLSCIDPILDNYLNDIYSLLDKNYRSHTTDIKLCGGGAEIIFDKFKLNYPQTEIVSDSQFANANGFYMIGLKKYYKYLVGGNY